MYKRVSLLAVIASVAAQRPSDISICDYYTNALLGSTSPADEYAVLTILVNTAVIGNYSACAVGSGLPGILAPAEYGGEQVNLLPYFNGCLESTNVNNVPSSVNFLDGGGAAPLMQNLPANSANSNQYFLLTHLYQFFGNLLGCSGYGKDGFPAYGGDPSMSRVQKYMSLDPNEIGYFISQVGAAAACLGVSSADVTIVGGVLESYFGYRCSPPRAIGALSAQLDSICENAACPLDPNADCGLYQQQGYAPYDAEPEPAVAPQCMKSMGSSSASSYYASSSKYESSSKTSSSTYASSTPYSSKYESYSRL